MASSFHLEWTGAPITRWDNHEVIWRSLQQPPESSTLVFWASQMTFYQTDSSPRGGGHFGPQISGSNKIINWGGYDDIAGPGVELRGSIPSDGANGQAFDWQAERDYLFRVFQSPKQNYLAAELTVRPGQITGDQQPGEIAWRLIVTDLSTGVETFIRDLLVGNCATSDAMGSGSMWSEDFNTGAAPTATVPWKIRWMEPRVNGRLVTSATTTYNTGGDSFSNTNSDTDKVGWTQESVVTRTNPADTTLTHPGAVARNWKSAALGSSFSTTIAIDKPDDVAASERLLAIIATSGDSTAAAPDSSWKLLGTGTAGAGDEARLHIFTKWTGASEPASYSFTQAGSSTFAGTIIGFFGADPVALPQIGSFNNSTSGTAWAAPTFTKNTNYGRIVYAVAGRPGNSVSDIGLGSAGSPIERVDTTGITGDWLVLAAGYETTPSLNGSAVAKTGSSAGAAKWQGAQIMVYPVLPRAAPVADASAGAWVQTPLWQKVDETIPDSSDYITGINTAVSELTLADLSDPNTNVGHVVRYAYRRQDAASATLLVELLQGAATVIASKTETVSSGATFVESSLALSTGQADSITDYTDLRIRLTATAS